MKIAISADMEGTAFGPVDWDEVTRWKPDSSPIKQELSREVLSACEGALEAGAKEILVGDFHGVGRNLVLEKLPESVKVLRGCNTPLPIWIDSSYDALIMIGEHSFAGSDGHLLAHTFSDTISSVKVNGNPFSEFLYSAYIAAYVKVPTAFLSGDKRICEHATAINPAMVTVAACAGMGTGMLAYSFDLVNRQIKEGVQRSLSRNSLAQCLIKLPQTFSVEMTFNNYAKAERASFYPGVKRLSALIVEFKADDYYELLRMWTFVL